MSAVPSIAVRCVRFNVTRGDHVTGTASGPPTFFETCAPTSIAGGRGACASAKPGIAAISITTSTLRKLRMIYFDFGAATAHAPDETFLIKTHVLAALLLAAIGVQAAPQDGPSANARPAWVGEGVSDPVWVLIE